MELSNSIKCNLQKQPQKEKKNCCSNHLSDSALCSLAGSGWMFYFVIFIQTAINTGVGIGAILLAGECLQVSLLLLL